MPHEDEDFCGCNTQEQNTNNSVITSKELLEWLFTSSLEEIIDCYQ